MNVRKVGKILGIVGLVGGGYFIVYRRMYPYYKRNQLKDAEDYANVIYEMEKRQK